MVRKLIFALFVGWLPVACGGDDAPGGTGPNGGNATVTGTVVDQRGLPVEGVVVSDGLLTTLTDESGYYALESDLSKRRFVQVTIPAAYEIPVKNGIPQFWRRIPEGATEFEADFTLQARRKAASRYTVLMTADPQIRSRSARYDNFAFHSIDMYEDMCRDLRETAASITDRPFTAFRWAIWFTTTCRSIRPIAPGLRISISRCSASSATTTTCRTRLPTARR